MADIDDDLEFNFDDDMNDLDIDPFTSNNEDVQDDRSPITKVGASALNSVISESTGRVVAKALRDHALPEGYKEAAYAADDAIGLAKDLYDSAEKELKPAKEALQKMVRNNSERIDSMLPSWLAERVKDFGGSERDTTYVDPQEAEITASLSGIFDQYQRMNQRQAEVDAIDAQRTEGDELRDEARHVEQVAATGSVADGISRLVGYQDSVLVDYQRKSLELQHRQFFALRDTLELARAGWTDQKTLLEAINKNVGLPDILKMRVTENWGQIAENQFLGDVQGNIHDYASNLTRNIRQNVMEKVKGKAQAINDGVVSMVDMVSMLTDPGMAEMGLSKEQMAGQMLAEAGAGKLTQKLGGKLQAWLAKDDRVADRSQQIMYYLRNFPDLLNEWAKSGATFGDNMMFDSIQEQIKSVLPTFSEDFSVNTSLAAESMDAMAFDRLAHRSIVDIIPGFLSRILQQVTAFNTGGEAERVVFDIEKERFMTTGEQDQNFINKVVDDNQIQDNQDKVEKLVDSIAGAEKLSPEARMALKDQLLTDRARGHIAFSQDRYKQQSWWDDEATAEELSDFFYENNLSWKEQNRLSDEMRSIRDSNTVIRSAMRDGNKHANLDILRRLGLLNDNNEANYDLIERINTEGRRAIQPIADPVVIPNEVSDGRKIWEDALRDTPFPQVGEVEPTLPESTPSNLIGLDMQAISNALEDNRRIERETWRSYFEKDTEGVYRLPVNLPTVEGELISPAGESNALLDSINGNFETTHALLQGITEAILNGGEGGGGLDMSAGGILSRMRSGAGKLKDLLGSYYGGLGRVARGGIDLAGGVGSRAISSLRSVASKDVYVKGREFPSLRADLMRQGFYYDSETDQPVKTLEEALNAEGAVLDRNGNIALSRTDIEQGLEDRFGFDLGGMVGSLSKPIEALWGWQSSLIKGAVSIPGRINKAVRDKLTGLRDVYVKGEKRPRLKAAILKNGGYFSALTGEAITSLADIDGDIADMYGNIILSAEDMRDGLVDRWGVDIDVQGLGGLIGDTVSRMTGKAWDLTKLSYKTTSDVVQSGYGMAKGGAESLWGMIRGKRASVETMYNKLSGRAMDELEAAQRRVQELGLNWGELSELSIDDLKELIPEVNWDELKVSGGDQLRNLMAKAAPAMQAMGRGLSNMSLPSLDLSLTTANGTLESQLAVQRAIYQHLTGRPFVDPTAPAGLLDASGNPIPQAPGPSGVRAAMAAAGDGLDTLTRGAKSTIDKLQAETDAVINELDMRTADSREAIAARIRKARLRAEELQADATKQASETLTAAQGKLNRAKAIVEETLDDKTPGWREGLGDKLKRGALGTAALGVGTALLGPVVPLAAGGYGLFKGAQYAREHMSGEESILDRVKGLTQGVDITPGGWREKLLGFSNRTTETPEEDDGLATLHGTAGERLSPSTARDEGPLGDEIVTGDDVASDVSTKGYLSATLHTLRKLLPEKVRGDTDGDGHREGSWQQYFADKEKGAGDSTPGPLTVTVEKDKEEEEGWLMKLLGGIGSIVGGGLGMLKDVILAAIGLKAGAGALEAGADLLGGADDLVDGADGPDRDSRRNRRTRGGRLGRFLGKVKGVAGKGLKAITSGAGRVATMAGGALASTSAGSAAMAAGSSAAATVGGALATAGTAVAGVAGTAAAAIAAAPVAVIAGAAIGAAAVGYGAYKVFSYFSGRADAEPLEGLRFLQYGANLNDKNFMSHLRDIEEEALDCIEWNGNIPVLSEKPVHFIEEFAEDMGVDLSHKQQLMEWEIWFQKRFAPVFLTHLTVCRALDEDVDLDDIDDEMDDEMKIEFIRRVQFGQRDIANKTWPYGITATPIPGQIISSMEAEVKEYSSRLIAMLEKEGDADDFDWMPPPVRDDAKRKLALEKEAERAAEMARNNKTASERLQGMGDLPKKAPISSLPGYDPTSKGAPPTPSIGEVKPETKPDAGKAKIATGEGWLVYSDKDMLKNSTGDFIIPTAGTLTSPYGQRYHPDGSGRKFHHGIDIGAPTGTPVYAAADGVIYRQHRSSSYGNVIYIKHDDGTATRYAHLHSFAEGTGVNVPVKQGQLIGYVGNTGNSFGSHLHFEHRKTTAQKAETLDPIASFPNSEQKKARDEQMAAEKAAKEEEKLDENTLEGFNTMANRPDPALAGERTGEVKPAAPTNQAGSVAPPGISPVVQNAMMASMPTPQVTLNPLAKLPNNDDVIKVQSKIGGDAAAQRERQLALMEEQNELSRRLLSKLESSDGGTTVTEDKTNPEQPAFNRGNKPENRRPGRLEPPKNVTGVLDLSH